MAHRIRRSGFKDTIEFLLNILSLLLIFCMLAIPIGLWPESQKGVGEGILAFIPYAFAIDYCIRLMLNGRKYVFSFDGKVDFIAFAPELVLSFFINMSSWSLLRFLRVFKLTRLVFSFLNMGKYQKFIQSIVPLMIVGVAFKMIVVHFEAWSVWPEGSEFNLTITVLGFCVAVLVGAKLSSAISRFYALEELTCKIVGTLRIMDSSPGCKEACLSWAALLKNLMLTPDDAAGRSEKIAHLRKETDDLVELALTKGANAPALAAFSQSASLLIHRMMAPTPQAYSVILKAIMILYIAVLITAIPSPLGLFLAPVIVVVLGLIHFVAEDLDNPMDYGPYSLIDIRVDVLKVYVDNRYGKEEIKQRRRADCSASCVELKKEF